MITIYPPRVQTMPHYSGNSVLYKAKSITSSTSSPNKTTRTWLKVGDETPGRKINTSPMSTPHVGAPHNYDHEEWEKILGKSET